MTRDKLEKVALALNERLGLQPKIDIKLSTKNLKYLIIKAADLLENDDCFTADTIQTLQELSAIPKGLVLIVSDNGVSEEPVEEPVKKPKKRKKRKLSPHIAKIEELIGEGKYTAKEIVDKILVDFPDKKYDTIMSYVRGAKNIKYSSFDVVAVEIDGIFSFKK
jgi:hypothetical protein